MVRKEILLAATVAVLASYALNAQAAETRPSAEQMEAVRACAAKQGVELPAPPPHHGKEGAEKPTKGEGDRKEPPRLTEQQKEVVDACFKASGLTPPKPPHGGHPPKGGEGKPPEAPSESAE